MKVQRLTVETIMKIEHSKWQVDKVIEMYKNNPFTNFTLENLKPIRQASWLGLNDIKKIIIEYNTDTSVQHPKQGEDIVRHSLETRRI